MRNFISLLILSTKVAAIGRTLQDCLSVAAMFDNTCSSTSTPITFAEHAGSSMSCVGEMYCPGSTGKYNFNASNPCKFTRKLCVTCREESGVVKIRVQTNGLPNHCFQSALTNAKSINTDWEVNFNPNVSGKINYAAADVDSASKVSSLLCDIQRTSDVNMIAGTDFKMIQAKRDLQQMPPAGGMMPGGGTQTVQITTADGLALSGAYFFNGLNAESKDAVETEISTLDMCLSHTTPMGQYHYHIWSPCIRKNKGTWSSSTAPGSCTSYSSCKSDPYNFGLQEGYSGAYKQNMEIIGIAKDGHVMYGPWNANG